MTWLIWFLLAFVAWVIFNWVAPFSVLAGARPISRGLIPNDLLTWAEDKHVRFYVNDLTGGYGFSVWAPPYSIVVFDKRFFAEAQPSLVRFVIAHELAHFSLGHHRLRWFAVVSGIVLLPQVRHALARMEDEADKIAESRTGFRRSDFSQLT